MRKNKPDAIKKEEIDEKDTTYNSIEKRFINF